MPANYVLIGEQTVNVPVASVTFANIPQTGYTDLKVVMSARVSTAAVQQVMIMVINSLTSGYADKFLYGSGSAAGSSTFGTANAFIGDTPAATATANTFGNHEIYIPNYTSTIAKSWYVESVAETNGSAAFMELTAGYNSTTSAISNLQFAPSAGNFVEGTTFSLYGIAALNITPTVVPKASGGDIVVNDGTYWYHAFLSSGVFMPSSNLSCDTLVIAGGGGGGLNLGGGGGAGGLRYATQSLVASGYSVTVGAGGAGGVLGGAASSNGSNSVLNTITSTGGGGGGDSATDSPAIQSGKAGGSGGGGTGYYSDAVNPGGAASPAGQGNAGGSGPGNKTPPYGNASTGGGGGAGVQGTNGGSGPWAGGAGGNGLSTYSSFGAATLTGQNISGTYWYAGGGGGSGLSGTTQAAGGNGGGGLGGVDGGADSTVGSVNTGGGGGGSRGNNTNGKAGGSGIVIVRYTMA
jgi:hypothetical protein